MKAILARLSRSVLNRSRPIRAGLLALSIAVTAVFAAPSPGMAAGDDFYYDCRYSWYSCQTGVLVTSFSYDICKTAPQAGSRSTRVCVNYEGDYVYVKDGDADTWSAVAQIAGAGSGDVVFRVCRNPHGAGTWARCNFNWSESGEKDVWGGIRYDSTDLTMTNLWSFSGA
jgi:hypothetical protein